MYLKTYQQYVYCDVLLLVRVRHDHNCIGLYMYMYLSVDYGIERGFYKHSE